MSDLPATRKDIDEVLQVIQGFIQQTDERFNQNEAKLTGMEARLDTMQREITDLKSSHDRLLNTIDTFIGRIDKYETEQAARDGQFERLLIWARKVSEKTGVPLENL